MASTLTPNTPSTYPTNFKAVAHFQRKKTLQIILLLFPSFSNQWHLNISEFPLLGPSSPVQHCAREEEGKHLISEWERKAGAGNLDKGAANKAISARALPLCSWRAKCQSQEHGKKWDIPEGLSGVWQPGPLPCPGLVSFHTVAMTTPSEDTPPPVWSTACPLHCEMSRMLFETDFLYLCSVSGEKGVLAVNLWLTRLNKTQTHTTLS